MLYRLLLLVSAVTALPAAQTIITDYVCLAPSTDAVGFTALEWVKMTYPEDVTSANDVTIARVNETNPLLGAWWGLDTKLGFELTGKILGDQLYGYVSKSGEGGGGCCADTLRIYNKSDASYRDLDIDTAIGAAMPGLDAHASHTFDIEVIDGVVHAFCMVKYSDPSLGGISADAIVAINTETGAVINTKSTNAAAFNIYKEGGESASGQDYKAGIFKIQFFNGSVPEEWHGNGVERFTAKDGTVVLAITHRAASEAVLFKCPYTYTAAGGGGNILQRFGTPQQYTATSTQYHYFGMQPNETMGHITGGVHNVYYEPASKSFPGKESMSLFVNTASSTGMAYAVEFALNLVHEPPATYDDTVFKTEYKAAKLSFSAQAQGGARAIGNGVLVAMSGASSVGLEVADVAGNTHSYAYPTGSGPAPAPSPGPGPAGNTPFLYDPFIFVRA